jgi:hypothetical protein
VRSGCSCHTPSGIRVWKVEVGIDERTEASRFVDAGVDELILVMQMGTVRHELVVRSLRTFAEKVMPHFA